MLTEEIKKIWPEWEPEEKPLGRGSYGAVYKAVRRDHGIESVSAIKIISIPRDRAELDSMYFEGMSDEVLKEYLERVVLDYAGEIRMMESFKGTQNIVSIEDYRIAEREGEPGYNIFIRMEFLTPLTEYLSQGRFSEEDAVRLGTDVCSALELLGRKSIVHRDIKPQNIFINEFGDFKLGDFGVAKSLDASLSVRGTPTYMAPEAVVKKQYDARSDIYSLGMVLYTIMNSGQKPGRHVFERRSERRLAPCSASPAFSEVILKACAENPDDRYSTPAEFKRALSELTDREDAPSHPEARATKHSFSGKAVQRKKGLLIALSASFLALLLAFGIFAAVRLLGGNTRTSAQAEDFYSAYIEHLKQNRESIDQYYWQKGWDGKGTPDEGMLSRPVCFMDVYGDEGPELIYIDARSADGNENEYVSRLHIMSFSGGTLATVYEGELDSSIKPINYLLYVRCTDRSEDGYRNDLRLLTRESDVNAGLEYRMVLSCFAADVENKLNMQEVISGEKWIGDERVSVKKNRAETITYYSGSWLDSYIFLGALLQVSNDIPELESLVKRPCRAETCGEAIARLEAEKSRKDEAGSISSIERIPSYLQFTRSLRDPDYKNGQGIVRKLTFYVDWTADGYVYSDDGWKYFTFRLEDVRKLSGTSFRFTVKELSVDPAGEAYLEQIGIHENAELYYYSSGTLFSELPEELSLKLSGLPGFSGYHTLPSHVVSLPETGECLIDGMFLVRPSMLPDQERR